MNLTYYGHSCFGVEVNGKHLLFDPFISQNPLAKNIDNTKIPSDYILISHAHQDHLADVEAIAKRTNAKIISNYEIVSYYEKKGMKGHGMNFGGSWQFDFGKVTYVVAIHSSQFPDGTFGGNPGGFIVESKEGNFYFAGDTALTMDMKLIGVRYKLDFALLPIGNNYTMDYFDAATCAEFIECDKIIGMHYDTFTPIKIDHENAIEEFERNGKELSLMKIGETIAM
ncbi:UPF0173 metal-dependent hydrolase [Bacteroidota bacterium]|nr:UPF0173 metal-dependent hydrolase [Bacteroidota bacterium]